MRKKTLWILLILSALLLVVGWIAYFMTLIPFMLSVRPASSPGAARSLPTLPIAGFIVTSLCLIAGQVIELVGQVGMLIRQAKQQQWAWFVCTLLLGWICQLVYLIVWPEPLRAVADIQRRTPPRHPVQPRPHQPVQSPARRSAQPQKHHAEQPQRKKSVSKKRS